MPASNYGRPTPPAATPIPTMRGPTSRSTRIFAALAGCRPMPMAAFALRRSGRGQCRAAATHCRRRTSRSRLFARGLLKQLYTRIYFADEPANDSDPVLLSIDDPAVRQTLIATRARTPARRPIGSTSSCKASARPPSSIYGRRFHARACSYRLSRHGRNLIRPSTPCGGTDNDVDHRVQPGDDEPAGPSASLQPTGSPVLKASGRRRRRCSAR